MKTADSAAEPFVQALREAAVMRILMAVGTLIECDAYVLRLSVSPIGVALGALHLHVQPS
jgi:hypothetical protein